MVVQLGKGCTE